MITIELLLVWLEKIIATWNHWIQVLINLFGVQ